MRCTFLGTCLVLQGIATLRSFACLTALSRCQAEDLRMTRFALTTLVVSTTLPFAAALAEAAA